jgi:hypothetical protein
MSPDGQVPTISPFPSIPGKIMISAYLRIEEEMIMNKFLMSKLSVHHVDNSNWSRG